VENVVIKFVADTEGLKPAIDQLLLMGKISAEDAKKIADINEEQKQFLSTLNKTTTEAGKLNTQVEELANTMSQEVIGKAADELQSFTNESKKATDGAKSLKAELRELKKQIASGDFTGKELEQMTRRAAELEDHLGDVNDRIKALASDTKYIDAMAGAMKGVAAAASVAAGASALFGANNEDLAKATQRAQAAMALLAGVQELAALATQENAFKTIFLDTAQKAAAVSSRVLGITISTSMAAATMGISLLVAAVVGLTTGLGDSEEEAKKLQDRLDEFSSSKDVLIQAAKTRLELIKDGRARELETLKFNYKLQNDELLKSKASGEAIEKATIANRLKYFADERAINKKYDDLEAAAKKKAADEAAKKAKEVRDKELKDLEDYRNKRKAIYADLGEAAKEMEVSAAEDAINARKKDKDDFVKNIEEKMKKQQEINDKELEEYYRLKQQKADADEKEKKKQQELQQAAIDSAQNISNAIFEITNRDINAKYEEEIRLIDERTAKTLENENLTAEQRKRIQARAAAEIAKIKTEQFKRQKAADIIQATINTALAVTRLLDNPYAAIAAGIAGAAQVAIIASQPIPKFAKGTEKFIAEGTGTADRGLAWLSHGERVVPSAVNNDYFDALSAIQNRAVDPTLANNIMTALSNGTLGAAQGDKLDVNKLVKALQGNNKQTTVNINIDEHGFIKFVQKGNSHREYVNKKFRYEA
jgi:myosin heavy subunit